MHESTIPLHRVLMKDLGSRLFAAGSSSAWRGSRRHHHGALDLAVNLFFPLAALYSSASLSVKPE